MICSEGVVTAAERERLWELVRNPIPGSKIAAAKEFGIDLTLTLENLLLTPTQRLQKMEEFSRALEELRRTARDLGR